MAEKAKGGSPQPVLPARAVMTDSVEIPPLEAQYDRMLVACGQLQTDDKEILDRIATLAAKRLVAYRGVGDNAEAIILFGGGRSPAGAKHLHLDIVRQQSYRQLPARNATLEEIAQTVAYFFGQRINLSILGRFIAAVKELPPRGLVRTTMIDAKVGDIGITQVASTIAIAGSDPIKSVEWSLTKDRERVEVEIEIETEMLIDSTYPAKVQTMAHVAFRGLILGETSSGSS